VDDDKIMTMIKVFLFFAGISIIISSFTALPGRAFFQHSKTGKEVYIQFCQSCHMENGEGAEGLYPPLAKTRYLKNSKKIIDIILNGQFGEVKVNGKKYNTDMPAQDYLTDEQIADVLTYIRSNWENKYPAISPAQVKARRK
jgi:nitrite reductase (NO-forming)